MKSIMLIDDDQLFNFLNKRIVQKMDLFEAVDVFNNAKNERVGTWDLDTMDEQNIKMIMPQTKALAQHIGKPLSKIKI